MTGLGLKGCVLKTICRTDKKQHFADKVKKVEEILSQETQGTR